MKCGENQGRVVRRRGGSEREAEAREDQEIILWVLCFLAMTVAIKILYWDSDLGKAMTRDRTPPTVIDPEEHCEITNNQDPR